MKSPISLIMTDNILNFIFKCLKPIFLDKYWHEKDLSHDTYFAKNIIVYYSGIMDRFNFINFMDSYNFNVNL